MRGFADRNPIVLFVYFLFVAGIAMFSMHPVLLVLSFSGAVTFYMIRQSGGTLRTHLWTALLFLGIAIVNPLFSHNGVTVLFVLNDNPITWEALCYGIASAGRIVAVLYWFRTFSEIMTGDRLLYLFGSLSPKLSLIFSMALRYVPLLGRMARQIGESQKALGLYKEDNIPDTIRGGSRVFSVLVTWTLENGIITADSMAARGYGIGRRTYFALYRFYRGDVLFLLASVLTAGVTLWGIASGGLTFAFYPALRAAETTPLSVVSLVSYGILAFLPTIMEGKAAMQWRLLQSKM